VTNPVTNRVARVTAGQRIWTSAVSAPARRSWWPTPWASQIFARTAAS